MATRRNYISKPQQEVITNAAYQILVIDPLAEIINDLENGFTYRLDFLSAKLDTYMKIAVQTLGYSAALVNQQNTPEIKNEYAKEYYLKYFEGLLSFFESHK